MKKEVPIQCRGRFTAAHRRFIGEKSAVGCGKPAPTEVLWHLLGEPRPYSTPAEGRSNITFKGIHT